MSHLSVLALGPERYAVEVREGDVVTTHKIAVHAAVLDDIGLQDADPARVARETVEFLLERETAAGLWEDFPIEQVATRYPAFYDELVARLTP
jgi:hypothetical protein